jgi:integrase
MAISSWVQYEGCQNGHTEITVHLDGRPLLEGFIPERFIPQQFDPATSTPPPPTSALASGGGVIPAQALPASVTAPGFGEIPVPTQAAVRSAPGVSLNALVEKFRASSGHLAASTREKFECHFTVAGRYLNFDREVSSIKLVDMRELKSKLSEGRKPSSVNDIIFKALGALFQIALDDEVLEHSPLEKLKRAKKGEPDRQQPTWEQAEHIAAEVATRSAESGLIVRLMLNFGVGQAEIKFLRGEHIDLANGVVHFRRKKTGKHFDVPIFPHATGMVDALKAKGRLAVGKPVVEWRNPRKALAAACERLDLPVYEPRALRRSFIVHALEIGVDPRLVARWQGHKDATLIFRVYGRHIDAQHEQRQAQKMGNGTDPTAAIPAEETNRGGDGLLP